MTVPASVSVATNQSSATFAAATASVTTAQNVNVTASLNGVSQSATIGLTVSVTTVPAFVQENRNQITSGKTNSVAFSSATTSGRLIVAYLIWDNVGAVSLTDTLGNTYVKAVGPTVWSNHNAQVFYAINAKGGADTVTATFATAIQSFGILYIHEYSGVDPNSPIDVTAAATSSSSTLNSGAAITTSANDLIFGAGVSDNNVTAAGSGFTLRDRSYGNITEDSIAATPGSYSATATHNGKVWAMQMVAFRPAAGKDLTPPSVPSGLSASTVSTSQILLSWNTSTDNVGVAGYRIYRNGVQVGTTPAVTYSDTGLASGTTYAYTVAAYDAAGNVSAQSAAVSATTVTPDTQAPKVSITSPANSQTVSGTLTIALTATDNVGVVGVQFKLDGANFGAEDMTAPYSAVWNTTLVANGSHLLTAVARDAAGNTATSTTVTVNVNNAAPKPYSTNFLLSENPISEGGNWINGKTNGLDWADVATTAGLAYGTQSGSNGYDDSTALLTGSWGPNQMAVATVHTVNQNSNGFEEVEIRLRSSISAHSNTGYEINFRCLSTGATYTQIVRWNGPLGSFTQLASVTGPGLKDGDVVKATAVGNVITSYINGVALVSATDTTYPSGNPGMGFFVQGLSGVNGNFGFTSYSASDTADLTPPSTVTNLSATAISATRVDLGWAASTDNVGVAGYNVFRNNTQIATATGTTLSDLGVSASTQYTYTVSAFDQAGNQSAQSTPVTVTTPAASPTAPPVPVSLQSSNVTSSSLSLSWTEPAGSTAAGYQVFRNGVQVGTSTTANYADSKLAASTTYSYTVAAYGTTNLVSAQSQMLVVTTNGPSQTPPSFVQVTQDQIGNGTSVSVSFTAPTKSGNTIVAYVIWNNTGSVALTDSFGDAFVVWVIRRLGATAIAPRCSMPQTSWAEPIPLRCVS